MKRSFNVVLKELRKSNNMSQQELAEALNLTRQSISNYETGKRIPSKNKLEIIAEYFNVDMNFLYGKTLQNNKYFYLKDTHQKVLTSNKIEDLLKDAESLSDSQINLLISIIREFKDGKKINKK